MVIIALIISLSLMMLLIKKKYSMGLAIFIGSIVLALLGGLSPIVMGKTFLTTLFDVQTLELVFSVFLISLMGSMMQGYGVLEIMMVYLEKTFKSSKLLLFIVPSLLASFSVAGSAVFAAPVIDVIGDKVGISNEKKAAINLYVRHAWWFVMPISASIVFAAYLADVSVWELMKVQAPVSIACLVAAYLVYIRPIKDEVYVAPTDGLESRSQNIRGSLLYTSPLLLSVVLVFWIPFYIALVIGCIITYFIKVKNDDFIKMLSNKRSLNMVFAAAAIMIFKGIIGAIPGIGMIIQDVINWGIPLMAILVILPFVMGYILANPQALIGMLFPILLPLVPRDQVLAIVALLNAIGFVTYFISPLHLCQALTNEYFCISSKNLYKEYYITVPVMFFAGIINYLILR